MESTPAGLGYHWVVDVLSALAVTACPLGSLVFFATSARCPTCFSLSSAFSVFVVPLPTLESLQTLSQNNTQHGERTPGWSPKIPKCPSQALWSRTGPGKFQNTCCLVNEVKCDIPMVKHALSKCKQEHSHNSLSSVSFFSQTLRSDASTHTHTPSHTLRSIQNHTSLWVLSEPVLETTWEH